MTAPPLRDRIAAAWSDHETGMQRPEGYVPCSCGERFTSPQALSEHRADVVLAVLADADPASIGGRTLTTIQMLERERDAMQRRTFELAEQIAAVRAELPEVLDLLRAVVERCVPTVLDAKDRPIDDLWRHVWHRLGNARPRTKENTNG